MVMTVAAQTNTEGIANMAVITASTDGASATAQTFSVGFVPRQIIIENLTDSIRQEWFYGMTAGNAVQTVANGTRTLSTTTGPTIVDVNASMASGTAPGTFTVPAATMVASKSFAIIAIG